MIPFQDRLIGQKHQQKQQKQTYNYVEKLWGNITFSTFNTCVCLNSMSNNVFSGTSVSTFQQKVR